MPITKNDLTFDASTEYTSHIVESPWGPVVAYFVDSDTLYINSPNRASGGTKINGIAIEFTMRLSANPHSHNWAPCLSWSARLDKSFAKATAGQCSKVYNWAREFAATTWIADHSKVDGLAADIRNKRQELAYAEEDLAKAEAKVDTLAAELAAL